MHRVQDSIQANCHIIFDSIEEGVFTVDRDWRITSFNQAAERITGVPAETHLARVMVSSDYRMKRISMKLDPSPVDGLASFLDLMKSTRGLSTDVMPRWWLACNYEPLARSDDGLAWELRGQGVKVLTEDDFVSDQGEATATGQQNPINLFDAPALH